MRIAHWPETGSGLEFPPMPRDPASELSALAADGLLRRLRVLGTPQAREVEIADRGRCLNFSSNDYLGLASHPRLAEALAENARRHGTGAGASRLVCGTLAPHARLEEELAAFKSTEAALAFSSGFAAATGAVPALCGKGDVVILDKLCHASLVDGARLSGAALRIFPHNDLDKLERHLRWARDKVDRDGRILVLTESVFSMDGDRAPLREIVELKDRHGALLLLDEAHAFGILGPSGRGLAAELGVDERVDLQMGTLSKAAGLSGGYICASRPLVDLLINRARPFIYSTAPSPALAATACESLVLLGGGEGDQLRERLWKSVRHFRSDAASPVLPWILGENQAALAAAENLLAKGFLVPAIRHPTVPKGSARLRITLSAAHGEEDIRALMRALPGECSSPFTSE